MIKTVFFDIDGVLFRANYEQVVWKFELQHNIPAGQLFASVHDRPYWKEFTRGYISETEYLRRVADDFSDELDIQALIKQLRGAVRPIGGSLELVSKIKEKYQTGVISNFPREWYEWMAVQFHFAKLFNIAVVSGLIHIRKPDKRIFEYALKQAGTQAGESVYIDDRPERMDGARELGIHLLLFKNARQIERDITLLINQEEDK